MSGTNYVLSDLVTIRKTNLYNLGLKENISIIYFFLKARRHIVQKNIQQCNFFFLKARVKFALLYQISLKSKEILVRQTGKKLERNKGYNKH